MQNPSTPRPPVPTEVRRRAEERSVQVTWSDGHVSTYGYGYLRGWCPCAGCQGHSGERHFVQAENTDLTSIEVVGTYAIGLKWGDGHDSGIYSYRYLRGLCSCPTCLHPT